MASLIKAAFALTAKILGFSALLILSALFSALQHRLTKTNRGIVPLLVRALTLLSCLGIAKLMNLPAPKIAFVFLCIAVIIGSRLTLMGLTGGIACGKSTVSAELIANGWTVIDADKIAREIMDTDEELKHLVVQAFGEEVIGQKATRSKSMTIDRDKLGQIIFASPSKRKQLNSLTHPRIFKAIFTEIFNNRVLRCRSRVILDAPLLFETGIFA